MTSGQATWLALAVAALEVSFLRVGASLSRGHYGSGSLSGWRSAAIAWLAATTVLLVIPFSAVGVLLSDRGIHVASATSVGVVVGSVVWYLADKALARMGFNPAEGSWARSAWRIIGYGAVLAGAIRLAVMPWVSLQP